MHAEIGDAVRPSDELPWRTAWDQHEVILGEVLSSIADAELSAAGLHEQQHVDIVVDVLADAPTRIEPDEIGVEIAAVRQAPHRPTAPAHRAEISKPPWVRRPTGLRQFLDEVRPTRRVATEITHPSMLPSIRPTDTAPTAAERRPVSLTDEQSRARTVMAMIVGATVALLVV